MEDNIVNYLLENALRHPRATAFVILEDGEATEKKISYEELVTRIQTLAFQLAGKNLQDKRVLLIYQDTLEFIVTFLACNYLGIVPVPMPYAKGNKQLLRLSNIMQDAQASAILCSGSSLAHLEQTLHPFLQAAGLEMISTDPGNNRQESKWSQKPVCSNIAFIQYTSGSTDLAKGVIISGRNLIHNQQLISSTFGCREDSVIFSWLPFHHDMGLIGNILHAIYIGCSCIIMSPFHFAQRPQRWLEAIAKYKVTHSGGPNFAYDLCVDRIPPDELPKLDLSSWKVAYNGSEPVGFETIQRFAAYFQPSGFQRDAFSPCYGLAEATLLVSGYKKDVAPSTIFICKEPTAGDQLTLTDEKDPQARPLVGSGRPADGIAIKIISRQGGHECNELEEGEICICGDSVTQGYWNKENKDTFYIGNGSSFLRTGDLGFFYKDELFVHGRLKEMLILRGRNIYPHDIEKMVSEGHPAIGTNGIAAFSTGNPEEKVVILAEIKRSFLKDLKAEDLIRSIDTMVTGSFGITAHDIVLTTPLGIPRTTSGKIQRLKCRDLYQGNKLNIIGSKLGYAVNWIKKEKNPLLRTEVINNGKFPQIRNYLVDLIECGTGRGMDTPLQDEMEFTEMGIDSLKATELVNNINKDLRIDVDATVMLENNTLAGLISIIENKLSQKNEQASIPPVQQHPYYPASNGQQRIWILSQSREAASAYNIITKLYLKGRVIRSHLEKAIQASIYRHESLRTIFKEVAGEPVQVILDSPAFEMQWEDLRTTAHRQLHLKTAIEKISTRKFDLEKGPLLHATLFQLSGDEYALIFAVHHIVSDGWSIGVLIREIMRSYEGYCNNSGIHPGPLGIHYKDYAGWLSRKIDGTYGEEARTFWKSQFPEEVTPLDFPADFTRPATRSFAGATAKFYLNGDFYTRILTFCRTHQATPFNFFRSALTILLNKFTDQKDITIGTPASGRSHFDLENQVGLYINSLPLRTVVRLEDTFLELLDNVSANTFAAFKFQDYPFDKIIEDLQIDWNSGRNPLFDIMLVLQNAEMGDDRISINKQVGFELSQLDSYLYDSSPIEQENISSKFDCCFNFGNDPGNKFYLEIEYATKLFKRERIHQLFEAYMHIVSQVLTDPGIRLSAIEIVGHEEKQRILTALSNNAKTVAGDKTITRLLEEQAGRTPGNIAVLFENSTLTYRELNERSNQLAHYLRREHNVTADDLVGIKLQRTEWLIVAVLGVLKSGGAYLPIDPLYPRERIDYMIADSACKVLIDQEEIQRFRQKQKEYDTQDPEPVNKPSDLAYVIYTSGSTGRPKGVMIEHRNTCAFIDWCTDEFRHSDFDTVLAVTSVCFDLSVFEILYTLSCGKKLRLLTDALAIGHYNTEKILLNTVPGVLGTLLAGKVDLGSVSVLNLAGEPVPPKYIAELDGGQMEIRNLYGPTEDTTYSTVYRVKEALTVPIGRPITDTEVFILNESLNLQPVGMVGEICISGAGLARGYLNNPALTAEKFIINPYRPGERMYRTGDWGRWMPDGNIEFIGRRDDQVKIRGYRIELGEIQRRLESHPDIDSAIVVAAEDPEGEKRLIAYFVNHRGIKTADLRAYLAALLPAYMIPAHFVTLESIPLSSNGKVDKKRLPSPDGSNPAVITEYIPPRDKVEEELALIWQEVLHREQIGVKDDFFDLGGHSLKASRLAGQLHKKMKVKVALNDLLVTTILEDQAELIRQAEKIAFDRIPPLTEQPDYALSSSQHRMWVMSQFEERNSAYNMPGVFLLEGSLDKEALSWSFNKLIQRHEILRTLFRENEMGEVRQFILPPDEVEFRLSYEDRRNQQQGEELARQLISAEFRKPFHLASGPLLRAGLIHIEEQKYLFTFVMHHIIGDEWSIGILMKELGLLYNACSAKEEIAWPPLRFHYKDYAAWQQIQLKGPSLKEHKTYWHKQFEGDLPVLELPGDKGRPSIKTYNGATIHAGISPKLGRAIKSLSRQQNGTLFMGLLTVVNALLYRYTGCRDIIVGSPIAGRGPVDLDDQVGLYINTLALRTRFDREDSYVRLFENVKRMTLEAYRYQDWPFDELVDALSPRRDMSRNALFDVMVVLNNKDAWSAKGELPLGGLKTSVYREITEEVAKFDLTFTFEESEETLAVNIEYNRDIYHKNTIERLAAHLLQLMEAIVRHPDTPIGQLDYLRTAEKQQLLMEFDGRKVDFPRHRTIAGLFEERVAATPAEIALVVKGIALTYNQLNEKANQLGDYLRKNYDIQPNDLIGIQLDRNEWMIIAILAALKAGGAYVPIDPEYPPERIALMLEDSGCKVLLDSKELLTFTNAKKEYDSRNLIPVNKGEDLVYVIYTSGSTGRPKGTMVRQNSFVNLIRWYEKLLKIRKEDCILLMAPVSFDLAQKNIFTALTCGIKLCLPGQLYSDYFALAETINREKVTIVNCAPSAFYPLLDREVNDDFRKLASLQKVVLGGEPVLIKEFLSWSTSEWYQATVINSYGPTECTDVVSSYTVDNADWTTLKSIPIGCPVDNATLYILDDHHALVPIGLTGEICISGICVGEGYWRQQALTEEKFVPDPFSENQRMYKTGDLGRWLPDGNIEYLGRRDNQVKIRGYRIELEEIESILCNYPEVDAAVVIGRSHGQPEKELIAYVVSKKTLLIKEIRSYLSSLLPDYMLPGHIIQLVSLPLSPSGKIDRNKLPDPVGLGLQSDIEYIAPRNKTEEKLSLIWQKILSREKIGIKDNFFDLGGHSLKATRLASQLHKEFGSRIGLKELFQSPVLEQQARLIQRSGKTLYEPLSPVATRSYYPLSSSQRRLWVLSQFKEGNKAYNISGAYVLKGILDRAALEYSFKKLLDRHESLRTVFREDGEGNIRQFIIPAGNAAPPLEYKDLRREIKQKDRANSIIQKEFSSPFLLSSGPLWRVSLLHMSDDQWILTCVMHHIISDGWSMDIFIRELTAFYNAQLKKKEYTPPPLSLQYKDYAVWQQMQLEAGSLKEQEVYWLAQLEGRLPVLELPYDKARPSIRTYRGAVIDLQLDPQLAKDMASLALRFNGTLFMGLLAAINILLYKYTGQQDIIIGCPIAGREHADLEDQVGLYINTLALRTHFNREDSYADLFDNVRQVTLNAYEYQLYPFDELVDKLHLPRNLSRSVVFDVMIILQNAGRAAGQEGMEGLEMYKYEEVKEATSKFDLTFSFKEAGEELALKIEYNTDVFNEGTIARMGRHLEQLLKIITEQPFTPIRKLDYLAAHEKRALLELDSQTAGSPGNGTIIDLFAAQAANTPEEIAVIYEQTRLTYKELDERSNQVGDYLLRSHGIERGDLVGIKLDRSEWMVIAMLGVLKTGASYVPMDPEYPPERIAYMLEDCQCKMLLDEDELGKFKSRQEEYERRPLVSLCRPEGIAYIIYTSGSSGRPKGVMIGHDSVSAFISWCKEEFKKSDFDVVFATTSVCFDLSVFEIFYTLCTGKKMRILKNALSIPAWLKTDKKILLNTVPGLVKTLLGDKTDFSSVNVLNMAGEPVTPSHLADLDLNRIEVRNLYGPSEDTTYSTVYRIKNDLPLLIGRPISHTAIYILDEGLNLQPVGIAGEICIAGFGLARGYLNNPELTADKFVPDPFEMDDRIYKTGDLGIRLADGNIKFLGRKDSQVKIRGYRIEPGEIENALFRHDAIESAIVLAKKNTEGEDNLIAYLIVNREVKISDIRAYLGKILPAYMLPGHFVLLKEFPLTPNGKIDKKKLPDPEDAAFQTDVAYVPPANATEEKLVAIWQELLGREKIGIKDNFFELGGHSLKAAQLISRINTTFSVGINIQNIFVEPTIESIGGKIDFILAQNKQRRNKGNLIQIEL